MRFKRGPDRVVTMRDNLRLQRGECADERTRQSDHRPRASPGKFADASVPHHQVADTIYTGGDIVTVNDKQPSAEAVAVKDGKILAVGARAAIERPTRGRPRRSSTWRERPCCRASSTPTATISAR